MWIGHYGRRCPMRLKWILWPEGALLLTVLLAVGVLTFLNVRDSGFGVAASSRRTP